MYVCMYGIVYIYYFYSSQQQAFKDRAKKESAFLKG